MITSKSNSEYILIYWNNILHLKIQRNRLVSIYSFEDPKDYMPYHIELCFCSIIQQLEYFKKEDWIQILKFLNE